MPLRTLHAGEGCQRVLACERSHEGFSCEAGGAHASGERLPQAGLRSSHRRWAARHSLSGRTQRATARHATTPTPALLLHRAGGAPLEQIHSGSDYRSRVTPQYLPIRASTPGKSANRTFGAASGVYIIRYSYSTTGRAQNIAIGLTGDPVALGSASGVTVSMNSQRLRDAAASLNASRSARSRMWMPRIA